MIKLVYIKVQRTFKGNHFQNFQGDVCKYQQTPSSLANDKV